MNSSLSGSTYILLTAKSSTDAYTFPKLSNTRKENCCAGSAIRQKSILTRILHFLKIPDQLVDENAFENDLVS